MGQERRNRVPRQCQPCTACCDGWVRITVEGREVSPGNPCLHSTGAACRIYDRRPDQCRRFQCGWIMQHSALPDWMKPNEAGVMQLPGVQEWRGRPVDVALPVGRQIPARALEWLKQFSQRHWRPLLYMEYPADQDGFSGAAQILAHGPPDFQREIVMRLQRGEKLW